MPLVKNPDLPGRAKHAMSQSM